MKNKKVCTSYIAPKCTIYKACIASSLMVNGSLTGGHNDASDDETLSARRFFESEYNNGSDVHNWE